MEIRFFAPGNLVSNLDFVETIFGNGGDPSLPQNDAGLDVEHWTGHTGCVILAPHLMKNIADEYFCSQDAAQDGQKGFAHRARELERMLDMALALTGERLAAG